MSTVVIKRPPRRPAPEIPVGELPVDAPPEIPAVAGGRWQQLLMVLPMLGGTVAMAMMFGRGGGAYSYVVGGMFGLSSLAMLVTSWGSASGTPKKSEMMAARRDYLRHLTVLRRRVRQTAGQQRAGLYYRHPDPGRLWSTVDSHRVWERRPTDPDFGVVRVAVGPQTLATPLVPPVTRPLEELEPMTAGSLRRFLDAYSVVPDLPVALSLRSFARVFVRAAGPADDGDGPAAQALARAMLAQLAVFHAPDELLVAVCAGPERRAAWEWVKWLPHAHHPTRTDALGPVRLVTSAGVELEGLLDEVLASRSRFSPAGPATDGPHVVVVLDGGDLTGATDLTGDGGIDAVTIIDLDTPPPRLLDRFALLLELRGVGCTPTPPTGTPRSVRRTGWTSSTRRPSPDGWPRCGWPRRHAARTPRRARSWACPSCSVSATRRASPPSRGGRPGPPGSGCGCRSGWAPTAAPSSWTSRSRRRTGWGRTAC